MNGKTILAASSALALASAGVVPLAALTAPTAEAAPVAQETAASTTLAAPATAPVKVEGTFAFTQDAVTSTEQLSSVFAKSVAMLCQSLPKYEVERCMTQLVLAAPASPVIQATVRELAQDENGISLTMACACASNVPGGGAMANAEVEGVSLESVAAAMGA